MGSMELDQHLDEVHMGRVWNQGKGAFWNIRGAILSIMGNAWVCKYLNISLDCHWPIKQMQSMSMSAQSIAIVPLDCNECAEMSVASMPY